LVCYSLAAPVEHCVYGGSSLTPESLYVAPCSGNLSAIAIGTFDDHIEKTGWSELHIQTEPSFADHLQAHAAGLLEGHLTVERAYQYILNALGGETGYTPKLATFVKENVVWIKGRIASHPQGEKDYWHQIDLLFIQFDALYQGYMEKAKSHQHFDKEIFYSVQLTGDLFDLCVAFGCTGLRQERINSTGNSHCSVLIKLLPGLKDIISGHTTWSSFETMTRIYKSYDFGYKNVPGKKIFFSSYPITLSSVDDFYQISSGLMVTETTIENHNQTLWSKILTNQVPCWMRAMVANRLSTTPREWMKTFGHHNSGTYNNQWMVLDYTKFTPGQDLPHGMFWVGEQMPGYWTSADLTGWLQQKGNWVSYNRPFFDSVFAMSGQAEMVQKYGKTSSEFFILTPC